MIKLFRIVLVVYLLAYLAWFFFPHVNSVILNEDEYTLLSYAGLGAYFSTPEWGPWFEFTFSIVTIVGLYCLVPVFRQIYVLYLLLNFSLQFSMGMVVLTGIESVILSFLNISEGLLLSLLYLSSVSVEFQKRSAMEFR